METLTLVLTDVEGSTRLWAASSPSSRSACSPGAAVGLCSRWGASTEPAQTSPRPANFYRADELQGPLELLGCLATEALLIHRDDPVEAASLLDVIAARRQDWVLPHFADRDVSTVEAKLSRDRQETNHSEARMSARPPSRHALQAPRLTARVPAEGRACIGHTHPHLRPRAPLRNGIRRRIIRGRRAFGSD